MLNLHIVDPKTINMPDAEAIPLSIDKTCTGQELTQRVCQAVGSATNRWTLTYQLQSRSDPKVEVEHEKSLEEQGILDGSFIGCRAAEYETKKGDESALRTSIARGGDMSYYYAHKAESAPPPEHRYVYGGDPAKIADGPAPDSKDVMPLTPVQYAWADEGDAVKIYIQGDKEPDAVAAAKSGKNGEVRCNFQPRSFLVEISDGNKRWGLTLTDLENEILPEESKYRVSAGKRVTLTLTKKKDLKWYRLVKPKT
eukprot:gnl/MRDRNA2_/MRDRNA2_34507_c0_seq1.p1 gnl/MRDRNA2_/MRDRNA2_34507_c0~~gnl/MRDRNA2_/MRDRNA2_34507_c0_seq1.p1  ORF type:complete len:254 (+),score=50.45 gnl/MRDRNA2_/MRDRNA2_34507_c0_seq1:120-881(+)